MESYVGHIKTQQDAIILFEACRIGLLPRIRRRLSERERSQIKSGSVFIWDEQEAGMRRWTDGKSWSASRVSGSFLTYREMEGTRRSSSTDRIDRDVADQKRRKKNDDDTSSIVTDTSSPAGSDISVSQHEEGYRYKPDGLYKQSFSIAISTGIKFHLISYYRKDDIAKNLLVRPTADPRFRDLTIPLTLYPESTSGMVLVPAITTGPLNDPMNQHQVHSQPSHIPGHPQLPLMTPQLQQPALQHHTMSAQQPPIPTHMMQPSPLPQFNSVPSPAGPYPFPLSGPMRAAQPAPPLPPPPPPPPSAAPPVPQLSMTQSYYSAQSISTYPSDKFGGVLNKPVEATSLQPQNPGRMLSKAPDFSNRSPHLQYPEDRRVLSMLDQALII